MRQIDLSDLSFAAKIKSDLMYILHVIEKENHPSQRKITEDFRSVVHDFIEFENSLQETFVKKPNN